MLKQGTWEVLKQGIREEVLKQGTWEEVGGARNVMLKQGM